MSTFHERSERERLEAIRMARYEATAIRIMEAQQAAQRASQKVLNLRLREKRPAPQLEFSI